MRERGGNTYCNSSALSSKKSRGSPSPRSDAPPGQPQHGPFRSFASKEFSCIVAGKLAYIERRKPMSALSRISVGLQAIVLALAFAFVVGLAPTELQAQGLDSMQKLSAPLANELVGEAVANGAKKVYMVTAVVVDLDGVRQAVLRGNGAPIHTLDNAFYKAYS